MRWNQVCLGQYIDAGKMDVQTGPFGTQLRASDYTPEGTPVINVRNVGYGDLRVEKLEFVPDDVVQRLSKHLLEDGDIVFGRKGAVDRHLLVKPDHSGWMQGSDCIRLRILSDDVLPDFLSFAMRTNSHKEWMITQCSNKATMASLNQDVISRIPIKIPELRIQQDIVEILSAYDDLIENNRRRIQLLEESARLLYKEWFVRLRFPGHEHVKVVDGVPEGWGKKTLSSIADITMGQSPKSQYYNTEGVGLPFHQGVKDFGQRFPENITYCTVKSRLAEAGDILFSVRAPVGRINVSTEIIVIGRGLSAIRSKRKQQSFLLYNLKNHFFKEDMIGAGAIYAAITKKDLHSVELLQPSDSIVEMFLGHVNPIDKQIEVITAQTNVLTKARDLLLPRLMNGEVAI
ncbi:restriction endonuclease subunit S, partial [Desulfovibrio inopinatus]|uniref:restriction endonuclease subunit S n=1 Tax=Desulfovibrio inopinatus TaxID=102109 RepID=UPI0004184F13